MANPFAPRANPINPIPQDLSQNGQDSYTYAANMIKRSGGDAKAAFYLAAKEKGVDPDAFLKNLQSMGDVKAMAQNALMSNPQMQQLTSLLSLVK